MPALPRLFLFYAALFAGFGVVSPFLPGLLKDRGLSPFQLGAVLAAGTAVRLLSGPLGGRIADWTGRAPLVLAAFTAAAAVVGTGYALVAGAALLTLVSVAHAAVLAPLTPVADAVSLEAAKRDGFRYGSVRGAGSAAFIAGTLLSGQLVDHVGSGIVIWLNAGFLTLAALLAPLLPNPQPAASTKPGNTTEREAGGTLGLLRRHAFLLMLTVAALIGGSHAMHDAFEVIRWRDAGLSARQSSVLWALSVGSEVLVFLLLGPWLLPRFGPARAMMLAAAAGIVRWGAVATTAAFPVMAVAEPLHGLTFALLHLACMDVIGRSVPVPLAATAQALYATVALGATTAAITLLSGPLYANLGPAAFWIMAVLCAAALPFAWALGRAIPPHIDHPLSG